MIVEWRPVPDFPGYEVSNTGLVRSYKRNTPCILKPSKHPGGYRTVLLRRNGKTHACRIGHLVLLAFKGPCPDGCEMCHNDGNSANDCLDNLRWDTHTANMQDASHHGVMGRTPSRTPEEIGNTNFVNAVKAIQKELGMTQTEFAEYIGIHYCSLSKLYIRGIKDNIVIKVLRKFPRLAYHLTRARKELT